MERFHNGLDSTLTRERNQASGRSNEISGFIDLTHAVKM